MIEQITANDFVDVKDIKGMFLYTKSNKIFSYYAYIRSTWIY